MKKDTILIDPDFIFCEEKKKVWSLDWLLPLLDEAFDVEVSSAAKRRCEVYPRAAVGPFCGSPEVACWTKSRSECIADPQGP